MLGNLTIQEIEDVINSQVIGRIGCHADDIIYIVPVSYAYDGECIYGHSEEGMKIRMMRKSPKVCFEVEQMEDMANWKSVIAWGEFEELKDAEARRKALEKLLDRVMPMVPSETVQLSPNWPFKPDNINTIKGIVYRVKLDRKTGRFEAGNGSPRLAG